MVWKLSKSSTRKQVCHLHSVPSTWQLINYLFGLLKAGWCVEFLVDVVLPAWAELLGGGGDSGTCPPMNLVWGAQCRMSPPSSKLEFIILQRGCNQILFNVKLLVRTLSSSVGLHWCPPRSRTDFHPCLPALFDDFDRQWRAVDSEQLQGVVKLDRFEILATMGVDLSPPNIEEVN